MTFSWSEIGSGFGEPGGTPSSRIPRSASPALYMTLYNEVLGRANDIIRPRKGKIWKVPSVTPYVLLLYFIICDTYNVIS